MVPPIDLFDTTHGVCAPAHGEYSSRTHVARVAFRGTFRRRLRPILVPEREERRLVLAPVAGGRPARRLTARTPLVVLVSYTRAWPRERTRRAAFRRAPFSQTEEHERTTK